MPAPAIPVLAKGTSALLGAGGSLLSNLFGNALRSSSERRAQAQNVKFWNMQNAYNHPSQQMARLKAAGLNPNLVYGGSPGGTAGTASPIGSAKASPQEFQNPIMQGFDAVKSNVQSNNTIAQTNLTELQSALAVDKLDISGATKEFAKELIEANLQKQLLQNIKIQAEAYTKNQTIQIAIEQASTKLASAKQVLKGQKLQNSIKEFEVNLNKMGIRSTDPFYLRLIQQILGVNPKNIDPNNPFGNFKLNQ